MGLRRFGMVNPLCDCRCWRLVLWEVLSSAVIAMSLVIFGALLRRLPQLRPQ
jgi:hypothetical protein